MQISKNKCSNIRYIRHKNAVETAQNALLNPSGKCIFFIDEIHRFNKLQQDALLPYVENGTIILIGATTENPYFEVNKALISRSMVFHLQPLTDEDIFKVLKKSLTSEDGLGSYNIKIEDETLKKTCNNFRRRCKNSFKWIRGCSINNTNRFKWNNKHYRRYFKRMCANKKSCI